MSMYKCPECSTEFLAGTKFCQNCGCNLGGEFIETPTCPVCRAVFAKRTKFCNEDGSQLVSPEKLIPKCVICGREYPGDTKFCPHDGGQVIPEALRVKGDSGGLIPLPGKMPLGTLVLVMGVIAVLIDVYIVLKYLSSPALALGSKLIGTANTFSLYLKYEVMGWIITALVFAGAAKFIDELCLENESKFSKIGAGCASIAGSVSLFFLVIGLLSKVITGL